MGLLRCSNLCKARRAEGRGHIPGGHQCCDFSKLYMLLPVCQKVCNILTDGSWYSKLGEFKVEDMWNNGVKCRAKVYKSLAPRENQDFVGCSAAPCLLQHLLICFPGKRNAGGLLH